MDIPSKQRQIERWSKLTQPDISELECLACKKQFEINKFTKHFANDMFNAGALIRYECPSCNAIFGDLRFLNLSPTEIDKDYEDVYSYYAEGNTGPIYYQIISSMSEFNDKTKTILDFAAGKWSSLIKIQRDLGYNILGYDKYVKDNNEYTISTLNGQTFDIVYTTNYIEHLINPVEQFRELMNCVNENGILVMIGVCWNYCVEMTHYHTIFFRSDKALEYICDTLNIYVDKTYSKICSGENIIAKVFRRKTTNSNKV